MFQIDVIKLVDSPYREPDFLSDAKKIYVHMFTLVQYMPHIYFYLCLLLFEICDAKRMLSLSSVNL